MADGRHCRRGSRQDVEFDFPIRTQRPSAEGRRDPIKGFEEKLKERKGAANDTVRNAGNGIAEERAP